MYINLILYNLFSLWISMATSGVGLLYICDSVFFFHLFEMTIHFLCPLINLSYWFVKILYIFWQFILYWLCATYDSIGTCLCTFIYMAFDNILKVLNVFELIYFSLYDLNFCVLLNKCFPTLSFKNPVHWHEY